MERYTIGGCITLGTICRKPNTIDKNCSDVKCPVNRAIQVVVTKIRAHTPIIIIRLFNPKNPLAFGLTVFFVEEDIFSINIIQFSLSAYWKENIHYAR